MRPEHGTIREILKKILEDADENELDRNEYLGVVAGLLINLALKGDFTNYD